MTPLPKRNNRNPSQRKHIPALDPKSLRIALDELQKLEVSDMVKRNVGDILKAAANPQSEDIRVVIQTLEAGRKALVEKTAKDLMKTNRERMARGRARIEEMSDDEWNELIERDE